MTLLTARRLLALALLRLYGRLFVRADWGVGL